MDPDGTDELCCDHPGTRSLSVGFCPLYLSRIYLVVSVSSPDRKDYPLRSHNFRVPPQPTVQRLYLQTGGGPGFGSEVLWVRGPQVGWGGSNVLQSRRTWGRLRCLKIRRKTRHLVGDCIRRPSRGVSFNPFTPLTDGLCRRTGEWTPGLNHPRVSLNRCGRVFAPVHLSITRPVSETNLGSLRDGRPSSVQTLDNPGCPQLVHRLVKSFSGQ